MQSHLAPLVALSCFGLQVRQRANPGVLTGTNANEAWAFFEQRRVRIGWCFADIVIAGRQRRFLDTFTYLPLGPYLPAFHSDLVGVRNLEPCFEFAADCRSSAAILLKSHHLY